jgi:hypothetical protein
MHEKNVIRLIQHGTPSQRKEMRELEHIRVTRIAQNERENGCEA